MASIDPSFGSRSERTAAALLIDNLDRDAGTLALESEAMAMVAASR